ncbi:MAG: hypothetical protein LUQ18_10710 [Methylococcaceae bacterium]|nr:hypothetical protein [Methylococcaceae bacterium]
MEIVCKNCNTSHYLSDDRIPLETKTGKCKQCSAPITVVGKNATVSIEPTPIQSTPPEPEATKNCDFCGEKILAIAKKCRHCGSMLDGSHAANSQSAIEPDIKPPEEITPPRTDDFVDNTLSYKVDCAIKKAVNTLMTRLTTFYSSYRTKNNTHNQQKITETLKKFAWFELIKSHSLKSKIIYIAVFVAILIAVITIGLFNLFISLFILLPVLWIVSLSKPRVVLANTRSDATKRIVIAFVAVVIGGAITSPPKDNVAVAPVKQAIQENEVKSELSKSGTILGNNPTVIGGVLYATDGTVFTGVATSQPPYSNGQAMDEFHYVKGIKEGLKTVWHKNGQKWEEENYKNGKSDGLLERWDENGKKILEANYKDGELVGGYHTEWDSDGNKSKRDYYGYKIND